MGYSRSIVVSITGARGSGKSLYLAKLGVEDMMLGRSVWSNMPIKISKRISNEFDVPRLSSQPLDLDAFYALSENLKNGTVCIDEAQNMSDSRTSLTLKNRLLNAIVAQIRKRSLNVYYTVQDPNWVDIRLRFATDMEVECYDLGYSPWGRNHNVDWGRVIRCRFKDLSGYITGTSYFQSGKAFRTTTIKGLKFWECYDSTKVTDLEEAFTSVKLDLKQRVISNKVEGNYNIDQEAIDNFINELPGNKPQTDPRYMVINQIVKGLKGAPIQAKRLFELIGAESSKDKHKVGSIMRNLGYGYQRWDKNYVMSE